MKKYQVRFGKRAQKSLEKMDQHQASIILAWIKKHLVDTTTPRAYGQELVGSRSGEWRYRIGDNRFISNIANKKIIILVLESGHRRNIYI